LANKNKIIYEFKGVVVANPYNTDDYKIYALEVDDIKYPHIAKNTYGNVSILGNLPDLETGIEYSIKAEEKEGKNGISYKVINIGRDMPKTETSTRLFLQSILDSTSHVDEVMREYPDIIDRVINNRLEDIDLKKLYNIGEVRFDVIKRKIIENFVLGELVTEFKGFIEFKVLKALYDKYGSVDKIKEKLQDNPYMCLCGLSRISFKTADKILLEFNKDCIATKAKGEIPPIDFTFDLQTSSQRQKSAIMFLLEENENDGNTKMEVKELRKQSESLANKCIEHFVDIVKSDKDIHFDKVNKTVALEETYQTEEYIAKRILDGLNVDNKWNIDTEKYKNNGSITLTEQQHKVLPMVCNSNVCILNGSAGCVDKDTEFFNGYKWIKISDYKIGDKVLQYNKDKTASLVEPLQYHKYISEFLWNFKTRYGIDQCLSDEHNVIYTNQYHHENNTGKLFNKSFKEIRELQQFGKGFSGKFITTFKRYGEGIDYDEWGLRLLIAIMADGTFRHDNRTNNCIINVKKDRKKERIIYLLNKNNILFKYHDCEDGFTRYSFIYPEISKTFNNNLYNCTKAQFEIIYDEIFKWDGNSVINNSYCSTIKENADFIQFVGSVLGYKCSIYCERIDKRVNEIDGRIIKRNFPVWSVWFSKTITSGINCDKREERIKWTQINKYKTLDGFKYCFTVPSGMLVLRRNNNIFITGNSGKSATTKSVIDMLNNNSKSFRLFSPTGRAAKILSEYTKEPASTIHRGLLYKPPIWGYNEESKLPYDVVVVDEFSMCDVFLMKHLLEAIDFNKTKLLMIGDSNQVPSVGAGNVFYDLINSNLIPIVSLTQIFRYGEGGVLTVATKTRNSEKFLADSKNPQIFGNDKGYMFIPMLQENIMKNVVAVYKKLLSSGTSKEDIMILSAYNVGDYGTVAINKHLQPIANPNVLSGNIYVQLGETKFYENDLVIQVVNNYSAIRYNESYIDEDDKTFVANGEIGKIVKIKNGKLIIQFDELVIYNKSDLINIKLSYSISILKSQGGQCEKVIMITPKAHTFMLNSNLIYVSQTRAKQKVFHFGEIETVNRAIKKKADFNRKTYLKELLLS